jgi:hypothetical protein
MGRLMGYSASEREVGVRLWSVLVIVSGLLCVAGRARAQDDTMAPKAQKHFDEGSRFYNIGDYADAAKEFKAGYLIDPQPRFLYAIAQNERMSGDCTSAVTEYGRYLALSQGTTDPDEQARRDNAQSMMDKCQTQAPASEAVKGSQVAPPKPVKPTQANPTSGQGLPKASPVKPPGPAPAVVSPPTVAAASPVNQPSLWSRHSGALIAGGATVVALAGGVTLGLLGKSADNAAHKYPGSHQQADSDYSTAHTDYLVANVLLGASVVGAAITTWLWLRAPATASTNDRAALTLVPLPSGAAASVAGTFGGP